MTIDERTERVVPSYDVWRVIRELHESGTVVVFIPPDMDPLHAERSVGAAVYGLARPGDAPVKLIMPRPADAP